MNTLYYVEYKSYFVNDNGFDTQMADGGEMPIIYSNLKKAMRRAENRVEFLKNFRDAIITTPTDEHPAVRNNCHFACTLTSNNGRFRHEIRVYTIIINQ